MPVQFADTLQSSSRILYEIHSMTTELLVLSACALLAGLALGWLLAGNRFRSSSLQLQQLQQTQTELQSHLQQLQQQRDAYLGNWQQAQGRLEILQAASEELQQLQQLYSRAQANQAALQQQLLAAREQVHQQQQNLQQVAQQLEQQFRITAQRILDEKSKAFKETNQQELQTLLNPFRTELQTFKKQVEETYDKESKERFSLSREVQRLIETTNLVSQEANNLSSALKGNIKQQGNWGELLLESILEHSGLTRGREYVLQEFIRDSAGNLIKDENGQALQPDVTIRYPDQRKVIVDAKVSLVAWDRYVNATNAEAQQEALREHIRSLRQHVQGLSRKNYARYAQALEAVILFVPIEAAFLEAMKEDTQLWKDAYNQRILLTSPTNLLAVLKIIADLWRIEQQSAHAIRIAEKAGDLYDKFVGFTANLELVGKRLTEADTAYQHAFKQLSTGKGNLVRRAEELKQMGASSKHQLPDALVQQAGLDDAE